MRLGIWTVLVVLGLAVSATAQDKPDELKRLVELAKEAQTAPPEDAAALMKEAEAIVSRRTGLDPAKDGEKFSIAASNLLLEAAKLHDPGWHKVLVEQEKRQRLAVARANLKNLEMALDLYRLDSGRYPTTEEGLEVLAKESPLRDPWGNAFVYGLTDAGYELHSCGPDGRDGTPDDVSLKTPPAAAPEPWTSEKWGFSLNLPVGWKIEALEAPEGEIVARISAEGVMFDGRVGRTSFEGSCAEYLKSVMESDRTDKNGEFKSIVEPAGISSASAAYSMKGFLPSETSNLPTAVFVRHHRAIDVAGTKLSLTLTCLKKDYEKLKGGIDSCEASFASTGVHVITSETWGFEFRLPFGWDVEVYPQAEDNTVARFATDNAAAYGGIVFVKTGLGAKEYMDRMLKNLGAEKLSDVVDQNGDGSDCHVTFIRKSGDVRVQVYTRVLAASGRLYVLSAGAAEDRYARYQGMIEKSAGTLKAIPSESPK